MLLLLARLQSSRRYLLHMVALVEATPQRSVRPWLGPQVMHLLTGGVQTTAAWTALFFGQHRRSASRLGRCAE